MRVWDLPTRLYHWVQLFLFIAMLVSGITEEGPHVTLGLILLTLLIWRVIWGFAGSETSRFFQFVKSPVAVINYLRGRYQEKPGHNPAGGWMVIVMIAALLIQCLTGLALSGMLDSLPGSEDWLTDERFDICVLIHENLFKGLIALSAMHVLAIIIYKLRSKPLVMAMITGNQKGETQSSSLYFASTIKALLLLVLAAIIPVSLYMLY